MKTIKMIIEDDTYNQRVEISHKFDSDVSLTDIYEAVDAEEMLDACLLGVGYKIINEKE